MRFVEFIDFFFFFFFLAKSFISELTRNSCGSGKLILKGNARNDQSHLFIRNELRCLIRTACSGKILAWRYFCKFRPHWRKQILQYAKIVFSFSPLKFYLHQFCFCPCETVRVMHHSGYGCNLLRLQCFIKYKILCLQGTLFLQLGYQCAIKAYLLRYFHARHTATECISFIHFHIIFCKFDVVGCLKGSNRRQLFSFILYSPKNSVKLYSEHRRWNKIYLFQTGSVTARLF